MAISNALILQAAIANRPAEAVNVSTPATGNDASGEEFGLALLQKMQDIKEVLPQTAVQGQVIAEAAPLVKASPAQSGLELLKNNMPLALPGSAAALAPVLNKPVDLKNQLATPDDSTLQTPVPIPLAAVKPQAPIAAQTLPTQVASKDLPVPVVPEKPQDTGHPELPDKNLPDSVVSFNQPDQSVPSPSAKPVAPALAQGNEAPAAENPAIGANIYAAKRLDSKVDESGVHAAKRSDAKAEEPSKVEDGGQSLIHQMQALAGLVAQSNDSGNVSKLSSGKDLPESKPLKEKTKALTDIPDSLQVIQAPVVPVQPEPIAPASAAMMMAGMASGVAAPESQVSQLPDTGEDSGQQALADVLSSTGKPLNVQAQPQPQAQAAATLQQPGVLTQALGAAQPKAVKDESGFSSLLNQADEKIATDNLKTEGAANIDQSLIATTDIGAAKNTNQVSSAKETAPPPMDKPLGQPGWSEELGERVVWMAGKGMQTAELHINPPHLGPMEVRIHLNQKDQLGQAAQASIEIVSQHAAVRDAVEASIPKLREMMEAQQLNVGDVNVSQQSFAEQRDNRNAQLASERQFGGQSQSGQGFEGQGHGGAANNYPESEVRTTAINSNSLLSLYA